MSQAINILWTGGWDSTFQLVRSFVHGADDIQPIYILDEDRPSTAMELLTMKRIKRTLRAEFPARAESLLPVRFFAVSDLPSNQRITDAYTRLRERKTIGVQYDWLGRFCDRFGISDLQLCIHKDDKAHAALQDVVEDGRERVSEEYLGTDEYELFKFYSFPIFDMSKREMQQIAREQGFGPIMNLTWFCHAPKDGRPCGRCKPCRYTIEEGLGWRVPYFRRMHGALVESILRPTKAGLKKTLTYRMR